MLFKKTNIYDIYTHKEKSNWEDIKYIKQGFSFYAFAFGAFWALFNKLWIIGIILISLQACLTYLLLSNKITQIDVMLINYGINFLLALEATSLKEIKLKKENYELYDVVVGRDEIAAELRFLDSEQTSINGNHTL